MKKDKKLTLNKQTITNLTNQNEVKGGMTPTLIVTYFASCLGDTCGPVCGGGGGGTGGGGTGDTKPTNCHITTCALRCK